MSIGTVSFGMDNCVTHHISNKKSLFISKPEPSTKIWVTGASGNYQATGVRMIKFSVRADNDSKHFITIDNVIELPQCSKNLISISKWNKACNNDPGIILRSRYSLSLWDDDNKRKYISHPSYCKIPLMTVNDTANKDVVQA